MEVAKKRLLAVLGALVLSATLALAAGPKSGKIQWEGTVRGDQIDVRYVWTDAAHWYKPNLKPLEKWGKGDLKKLE